MVHAFNFSTGEAEAEPCKFHSEFQASQLALHNKTQKNQTTPTHTHKHTRPNKLESMELEKWLKSLKYFLSSRRLEEFGFLYSSPLTIACKASLRGFHWLPLAPTHEAHTHTLNTLNLFKDLKGNISLNIKIEIFNILEKFKSTDVKGNKIYNKADIFKALIFQN